MKRLHAIRVMLPILAVALLVRPVVAQADGIRNPLLDRLIGHWVLQGNIAGGEVTHDVEFEWVLARNYVRFHELSREQDSTGAPVYEAIVFIGWDEPTQRYACLWLDVTGGGGLTGDGIGYAKARGDTLPFVFDTGDGSLIYTTFAYDRKADTWQWQIDNARGTNRSPFARVTLTRR